MSEFPIQVLMATMNRTGVDFLSSVYKFQKYIPNTIVINQSSLITKDRVFSENILMITRKEKGVTRGRNQAISEADSEIIVFSDDDVCFTDNAFESIYQAHQKYEEYDIIIFQAITPEGNPFRSYPDKIKKLTLGECSCVGTIEITAKRQALVCKQIKFDERFGAGAEFPANGEWIFLADAIKRGIKVLFVPKYIVIHPEESSGTIYKRGKIEANGAAFIRIFNSLGWLRILISLRHIRREHLKYFPFRKFVRFMFIGALKFYRSGKPGSLGQS